METKADNQPLVSVVVITYNSAKFVLETLESVKAQTYDNIELIISDDGSTDDTVDITREWLSENGSRFVRNELVLSVKNTGISPNCNRGIRSSKGEWIKLIAGDDLLLPNCVSDNVKYIHQNKDIKVLFSGMVLFNADGDKFIYVARQPLYHQRKLFNLPANIQYLKLIENNFVWAAASSFINRSLLDSVGLFDERFPYSEDYPMWLKMTRRGISLYYFHKATTLYRQSESIKRNKDKWVNIRYFKSAKKHFDLEVRKLLRQRNTRLYYQKQLYIIKYLVLIRVFRNKINLCSRAFSKAFRIFRISPI